MIGSTCLASLGGFIAVTEPVEPAQTLLDLATLLVIDGGIVVIILGMLICAARLLRGPHLTDRAVAVDTITVHLVALVALLTMRSGTLAFFDGALALSLLGFVSAVAMGQFVIRRRLRELNVQEEVAKPDASQLAPEGNNNTGEAP